MVKRIRGTTFSTKVATDTEHAMFQAARGIFNRLIPDVYIFLDHRSGQEAGKYVFGYNFFIQCSIIPYFYMTAVAL